MKHLLFGSEKARNLFALRAHLLLTASISTLVFATMMAISVFVPLGAQLNHMDPDDPVALGMAEHFMFLHSALWPLVVWSLIASIGSATFLYQKMRAPLARFMACYDAIAEGEVPEKVTIRTVDYLTAEAEALNAMISALGDRSAAREKAVVRFRGLIDELTEQRVDEATVLALEAALGELSGSR